MLTMQQIAQRIVQGIQAQPGDVVQIADRTGNANWPMPSFWRWSRSGPPPSST
ncbi:MAG: hypothetical protein R3E79_02325 [Caldilineaceae bacterium]